jgi:hypothetical protein
VAKLISEKAGFKTRRFVRDKEGNYVMIQQSFLFEETIILNSYASNNKASKYIRQKLIALKGEIDKSTFISRSFHNPLSVMPRQSEKKNQ